MTKKDTLVPTEESLPKIQLEEFTVPVTVRPASEKGCKTMAEPA
jgi:hypothetical protein